MKIKKLACAVLASSVLAICAGPAHATLMLRLDAGGGNTLEIVDNGAGDDDLSLGGIAYSGSLGTWMGEFSGLLNWRNFTGGLSNSPGVDGVATLDLFSLNRSRGAGTLTITLTDDGYTTPNGLDFRAFTEVGGVSGGNITFNSLLNGSSVSTINTGVGAFSGTNSAIVDISGGFTLTQIATITNTGAGQSSFNIITSVPEPATLGLLGLGLIGLGFVRRRRKY